MSGQGLAEQGGGVLAHRGFHAGGGEIGDSQGQQGRGARWIRGARDRREEPTTGHSKQRQQDLIPPYTDLLGHGERHLLLLRVETRHPSRLHCPWVPRPGNEDMLTDYPLNVKLRLI
jgi:hypothetical protein